jgi:hypothetical protein
MSKICQILIAGDIDRKKLEMFRLIFSSLLTNSYLSGCRSNAKIYSDEHSHCNIEFLEMNAYDLIHSLSNSKQQQVREALIIHFLSIFSEDMNALYTLSPLFRSRK